MKDQYLEWMIDIIGHDGRIKNEYLKLLSHLDTITFTYNIPMDSNRATDGEDLRYRFGREAGYGDYEIAAYLDDRPCSVLEMMIALSIRCEENIMDDPDCGNRTGEWFWHMIANLHLDDMADLAFDYEYVNGRISDFLNRKYDRNGDGGLFTVIMDRDMRSVEIWYQMCWYLDNIIRRK